MDSLILADLTADLLEKLTAHSHSWWAVFWILALATYASEDLACISGGLLASQGMVSFPVAVAGCAVGIWTGDIAIYWLGKLSATGALKWKWLARRATPERIARGRAMFDQHGVVWIFLTRFMPGSRVVSYLAAGATGWSFSKFAITLAVAALIWTPALCGISFLLGDVVREWMSVYERNVWWVLLGLAGVIWLLVSLVVPMFHWRGRRKLYGRWLRITRWEFWPSWLIYLPVLAYIIALSVRYRNLMLFTSSSPAIPHSGFAMDSKDDILQLFDPEYLPKHNLLETGASIERLESWMAQENLTYPVVLKPDIGERGQGVAIIKNRQRANDYLTGCHEPIIAQEFVGGLEYGVYYQRLPGEASGKVYSLSCKHPQSVTGDGESTLEQLILNDPRAVAMAHYFLNKFSNQLNDVLPAGETFPLAEIGTHARGAVFTDDRKDITPELEEAIDRITQSAGEIYCGRYDLRVPSVQDLREGKNIKLLEFNGVTAEPAHIYQPGYPLRRGITDLCQTWSFIFSAGEANRLRGHYVSDLTELIDIIRQHRRRDWYEA